MKLDEARAIMRNHLQLIADATDDVICAVITEEQTDDGLRRFAMQVVGAINAFDEERAEQEAAIIDDLVRNHIEPETVMWVWPKVTRGGVS